MFALVMTGFLPWVYTKRIFHLRGITLIFIAHIAEFSVRFDKRHNQKTSRPIEKYYK